MNKFHALFILFFFFSCQQKIEERTTKVNTQVGTTSLIILGSIQDAGSPHIACKKECCKDLFENSDKTRKVVSLGVWDKETNKRYLFEATPDVSVQMKALKKFGDSTSQEIADGIFLTHAHIGHYSGLMYLGKEATNAKLTNIYAMPRMSQFLKSNGPWSQLVKNKNISINTLKHDSILQLSNTLSIIPFLVPHRDEFSETVGYKIIGPKKTALFIPDIDKWEKWEKDIIEEIQKVDFAFLDATFYSGEELNNRDITQIPHPFIIESMVKFDHLQQSEKQKIIFIHFNHTNPVIDRTSEEAKTVLKNGFRIAEMNEVFTL